MGKSLIIPLSFKKDEQWLYDLIDNYSDHSGTIKDILKKYFQNDNDNKSINQNNNIGNTGISHDHNNDSAIADEISQIWNKNT